MPENLTLYEEAILNCNDLANSIGCNSGHISPERLAETLRSIAKVIDRLSPPTLGGGTYRG